MGKAKTNSSAQFKGTSQLAACWPAAILALSAIAIFFDNRRLVETSHHDVNNTPHGRSFQQLIALPVFFVVGGLCLMHNACSATLSAEAMLVSKFQLSAPTPCLLYREASPNRPAYSLTFALTYVQSFSGATICLFRCDSEKRRMFLTLQLRWNRIDRIPMFQIDSLQSLGGLPHLDAYRALRYG